MIMQRVPWRDLPIVWLAMAVLLTAFGIAFVASATYDAGAPFGLGREARLQLLWWAISAAGCAVAMHVSLGAWKQLAVPLYVFALMIVLVMIAAAGTSLVPRIKGQSNWIALYGLRLQPVEFVKLMTLLACARLLTSSGFDVRRALHAGTALAVAAVPAALIAKEDLGSALTFPPMIMGMLFVCGLRIRHLLLAIAALALAVAIGVALLPEDGYQYKRLQAWLHPDEYQLTEGYQAERSKRSIGSGQWLGKGWGAGDQNRLGWVPEKHTDLIVAVVGEEVGFVGSAVLVLLFAGFAWAGLAAATLCRDPCGRIIIVGFVCLVLGQTTINLAVALALMPVTGVTLPFISYGGSSLLGSYLGLGLSIAACVAKRDTRGSASGQLAKA